MRITQKAITVLALLEKGAKYGDQLAKLEPKKFYGTVRTAGETNLTNIYTLLRAMEKGGLIRHMKDFHPDVGDGSGQANQRKWYDITAAGRSELAEARTALGVA